MSVVGDAIRKVRQRKGWSIAKLAGKTELDGGYISRIETGKIGSPGSEQLRRIASALEVSVDELLALQVPCGPYFSPVVMVPIVNISLSAGVATYGETRETLPVPAQIVRSERMVASRVTGDCMEPEIRDGDVVVVDISGLEPRIGDLVAVLMEDGNMMVKRYDHRDGRPILLDNHGGEYRPNGAKVQGVVVYVGRAYR